MKKRAFIFFSELLVIGIAGYFVFAKQWIRYIFAHLGALGIMGFLGLLAAIIAASKGYGFRQAFLLGFALPTLLGILTVLIAHLSGGKGCGGAISLAASFLVIALYCFAKKKNAG